MTEDRSEGPTDKFRVFAEKMAGLLVPADDVEQMRDQRKEAIRDTGPDRASGRQGCDCNRG
jgi:hypothetical protein